MVEIHFKAMGCQMMAALDSTSRRGAEILEQVPSWFEAWEQSLSRFRPDSELSRFNQSAGESVPVSRTLWEVYQTARQAIELTEGLVTPVVLDALVRSGYDRSFEQLVNAVDVTQNDLPVPIVSLQNVNEDPETLTLRLPAGTHLDFGGIAKGWAAEQAVSRLKPYGPALVDAGGDIAVSGLKMNGEFWPVGVEDPAHPDSELEILLVGRSGIATSGTDYRRWQQNGNWRHHIIDPRTGLPADTDVLAVTVIAPRLSTAEAAAKTVLILGSQDGLGWLDDQPGCEGLLVMADGSRMYSRGISTYLWSTLCQQAI